MLPLDPGTLARGREGMKKGQTHRYMDSEARIRWSSLTYHCNPEPQCAPATTQEKGSPLQTCRRSAREYSQGFFVPAREK